VPPFQPVLDPFGPYTYGIEDEGEIDEDEGSGQGGIHRQGFPKIRKFF
jgi:hypothetical protein